MQNFLKKPSELAEELREYYKYHPYPVPGYEWGVSGPIRVHTHGIALEYQEDSRKQQELIKM